MMEPEREYDPNKLLNLPAEIQDKIGENIYKIRLSEQENINNDKIVTSLEQCLIYHFFVRDIKDQDIRADFKNNDSNEYLNN